MLALGRASRTMRFTSSAMATGSSAGISMVGPRCQPSDTESMRPETSNTRPVTSRESGLASHTTIGEMRRGAISSLSSSDAWPIPRFSVMRVSAAGAMAFTVTPYRPSSLAAMTVKLAMPALAAP